MTTEETIKTFKHALGTMSHSRAGWDFDLPPAQRAEENRAEQAALSVARSIWADHPEMHDALRAAFSEVSPLATMSEIENLPIKAAPEVPRTISA